MCVLLSILLSFLPFKLQSVLACQGAINMLLFCGIIMIVKLRRNPCFSGTCSCNHE